MPKLYVVATPIGNLSDLTPRMREAIESAGLIAAEDTRVTMKLLNHWDLKKPLVSCHRHNEEDKAPRIVERMLAEDLTVALTCDAVSYTHLDVYKRQDPDRAPALFRRTAECQRAPPSPCPPEPW